MKLTIVIFAVFSALYWMFQLYSLIRSTLTIPRLKDFNYGDLEKYPLVSVIITACNEAENIESAMNSRLEDDYPELEFILIDDRSTDGTGEIVDRIAAKDARVKTIHITELPDGWLGKVHALHKGVEAAKGDFLLFSDGDVHVKKGTLKQLIAKCEDEGVDHVPLLPAFHSAGFFVDASISVFLRALLAVGQAYKINDKKSRVAGGAGAFNLVRRSAYNKTKGFPWIKMEIIDDVTLGQMLKETGATPMAIDGKGFVEVPWYTSFKAMMDGAGRAGAAALGNYNGFVHLAIAFPGYVLDMMPFIALFSFGISYLPYIGLAGIAAAVGAGIVGNRMLGLPLLPGILLPVAHTVVLFVNVRGALKFIKDKGITWRGTFYPKKQLKQGRRFRYFLPKPGKGS